MRLRHTKHAHHKDVECGFQHANDRSGTDHRTVTLCEVVDEQAQVKVSRLLLSKLCAVCEQLDTRVQNGGN